MDYGVRGCDWCTSRRRRFKAPKHAVAAVKLWLRVLQRKYRNLPLDRCGLKLKLEQMAAVVIV